MTMYLVFSACTSRPISLLGVINNFVIIQVGLLYVLLINNYFFIAKQAVMFIVPPKENK
jgi:hypothetical protein